MAREQFKKEQAALHGEATILLCADGKGRISELWDGQCTGPPRLGDG